MNIVGFNFTRISAERKRAIVGTVNINNNIRLRDVAEAKIGIGDGDRKAVKVSFTFKSEYSPNLAMLEMDGDVLLLADKKEFDTITKQWKDKNHIPQEFATRLMNHILDRCNIQALLISKDLNLPSPVPLPKVNVKTPEQKPVKKKTKKAKK